MWLITTTFGCITAVHYLMWFKETRKSIGKFLKRFVQKYMPTNNGDYTSIPESENDELILFLFIQRILFPTMGTAVLVITIADLSFFSIMAEYHRYFPYIYNFYLLFPWPMVAIFTLFINILLTLLTSWRLIREKSLKCCSCESFLVI